MEALGRLLSQAILTVFISGGIMSLLMCKAEATARFNTSLMAGNSALADWNNSEKRLSPGIYDLDIYVNGEWRGTFPVWVADSHTFAVQHAAITALSVKPLPKGSEERDWTDLSALLYGGSVSLNTGLLRLNLTIPQAYVIAQPRRWVAPERWNPGINGAYTNYHLSYYHAERKDGFGSADNIFLTLKSGLNLAAWQLSDNSNFLRNRKNKGSWSNNSRYIERALPSYRSLIRVGDGYTNSPLFDNLRFRGVTLKQEARMYPDAYRTYMPVIRGTAVSNAVVKVYQNSTLLYQINVPPGPFEITDLMPSGARNDLTVEVDNSDGSLERFIVPYSTASDMLRMGSAEWLVTAGNVQIHGVDYHPGFLQGNAAWGVNNYLTGYGGVTLARDYQSLQLGSAISVPLLGSFSGSVDVASAEPQEGGTRHGQRLKLSWSRYFPGDLNLTLASWYYHTSDYYSFYDAVQTRAISQHKTATTHWKRNRQTFSANLDQTLAEGWGRVALSGFWRQYWNSEQSSRQFSLTWSNTFHHANWSLALRRNFYHLDSMDSRDEYDEQHYGNHRSYDERRIDLAVNLPFALSGKRTGLTLRSSMKQGKYNGIQTGINGTTSRVDYNLNYSEDRSEDTAAVGWWSTWRTPYARVNHNFSQASHYRQIGGGVSGSALIWREGLLTSASTGNTFAILDAPGIVGATVNGNADNKTNRQGRALIPSATPYKMNSFRLEQGDAGNDWAELKGNIGFVAPWAGSISYLRYQTDTRKVFVMPARFENGEPLPFGTDITDVAGEPLGYVAQGSKLYIKADQLPEWLVIRLSDGQMRKSCRIHHPTAEGKNSCVLFEETYR